MNWVSELYDLYEKNEMIAGQMIPNQPFLLPLYHTTSAAQITVTINEEGEFLNAEIVPEDDKTTIIPVTEKSASRTAGVEPHPLCDNLKYLAGDYNQYVDGKDYTKNYEQYLELLADWADSPFSHRKVQAVYQYIKTLKPHFLRNRSIPRVCRIS